MARSTACRARAGPFRASSMTSGRDDAAARCSTVNVSSSPSSDTVVWVNTRSGVYHFGGMHNYGHTKEGAYMCEADAKAAGDRAAMNEHHP